MAIITIGTIDQKRLKNAEHAQLFTNLMNVIEGVDAEAIGLKEEAYQRLTTCVLEEVDIVNNPTAGVYTKQMQDADLERCTIFRRVRNKLALCELENPSSVAYKAWDFIKPNLMAIYPASVVNLPYQEKTATITGFISDCRTGLSSQQIEGIGIDGDLDDLVMSNQKFQRLYQEKVNQSAETVNGNSLIVRANTEEAWQLVSVNLVSIANNLSAASTAQATAATDAIGKINVVIADARQRLATRLNKVGAVVDTIEIKDGESLPYVVKEGGWIKLEGTKLTVNDVFISYIKQPIDGPAVAVRESVEKFVGKFGGKITLTKDEETNYMSMTIEGFNEVTDYRVTITDID